MDHNEHPDSLLPPALLAEVEAIAAREHRSARDVLHEAVEHYIQGRRPHTSVKTGGSSGRTPQEAAARVLERREFHALPDGMTIRDLMTFGRA